MRVYRTAYTTTPPSTAVWKVIKGKRVASWESRKGKLSGEETAKGKVRVEVLSVWYYDLHMADGSWKQFKGVNDKQVTHDIAVAAQAEQDRLRYGLVTTATPAASKPLLSHVSDYITDLRDTTAGHQRIVKTYLTQALAHTNARTLLDFTPAKVRAWVESVRRTDKAGKALAKTARPRIGPSTCNHRLTAIKSFCEWMVTEGRADRNPLARLEYYETNIDVRRDRRSLSDDEFGKLLVVAKASALKNTKTNHRPFGTDREMVYLVAAYTGFRAAEVASLTPASFDLAEIPRVTVAASYSKRKRKDTIEIPDWLAERLRAYLEGKPASSRIWPGKWYRRATDFLYADLLAAGVERSIKGKSIDFHSLRRTYVRMLLNTGPTLKELGQKARHHSAEFTLKHYADNATEDRGATLANKMPKPGE